MIYKPLRSMRLEYNSPLESSQVATTIPVYKRALVASLKNCPRHYSSLYGNFIHFIFYCMSAWDVNKTKCSLSCRLVELVFRQFIYEILKQMRNNSLNGHEKQSEAIERKRTKKNKLQLFRTQTNIFTYVIIDSCKHAYRI